MQLRIRRISLFILGTGVFLCLVIPTQSHGALDVSEVAACDQFMVPKKEVNGTMVGQEACRMMEVEFEFLGRKFKRVEIGVTGTVAGYALKDDTRRYANYFNVYPEFVYQQAGEMDEINADVLHGIGRYSMATGHMVSVVYPMDRSQWNGKLFLHNHGAGRSFARGNAKPWNAEFDPEHEDGGLQSLGRYERVMLEKGYVLAKTRRSTLMQGGDVTVTLDDGTELLGRNLTEQPPWIMEMAKLAGNMVNASLGAQPSRIYWYGHSGGARPGRMVNYKKGLNVDDDGTPIIDGLIVDDAGGGLWLPILMKDGKDILFQTDADKQRFVPMIEISHLLYVNETPDDPPSWMDNNFLAKKRINAKTLMDKGLGDKFRYYEIDGISHGGPGSAPSPADRIPNTLDMDLLMEGFIDMLDAWVEDGVAPSPNRSDWRVLGDADNDGVIENPAIDMPEVACPLGVFHIYGSGTSTGSTRFTPFSAGSSLMLEPLDGRGEFRSSMDTVNVSHGFVDMNGNNYRDFVETATEAWQRVGLLKPNEAFNRERFVQCVRESSTKLVEEKFFMPRTLDNYLQKARTMPLPEK